MYGIEYDFQEEIMSKLHYIIDAGHGGMLGDKYSTAPNYNPKNPKTWKKMWIHNGVPFYEGVYNRKIVGKLEKKLIKGNISHTVLVRENEDISLKERVNRINQMLKENPKTKFCVISIHGNAAGGNIRTAVGDEIWTSVGETKSDDYASNFGLEYSKVLSRKFRKDTSDGDLDKESNFYILRYTKCPAFLTENGFFDNPKEAEFMSSEEGIEQYALAHYNGIIGIEKSINTN